MTTKIQYGPMKPRILEKINEPWLRVYADGRLSHGYQGEGSIQKAIKEIIYCVDDNGTVVEFFIDDFKYELPAMKLHHFWGEFEGGDELRERIEYLVDFHKTFYYLNEKEE